jgi:hypothetical protein
VTLVERLHYSTAKPLRQATLKGLLFALTFVLCDQTIILLCDYMIMWLFGFDGLLKSVNQLFFALQT